MTKNKNELEQLKNNIKNELKLRVVGRKLLNDIFDYIFSNLSMESFYRLLIPVGKINTIYNDKSNIYAATTDYEEYTYYINVNNVENLSDNINFNYFYLKNLKNPHNEYDYTVSNINNNLTCHTDAYSFSGAFFYKMFNYINTSIEELKQYIDSNHRRNCIWTIY